MAGTVPAYQGLDTAQKTRMRIENRLIENLESIIVDRMAQVIGHLHARLPVLIHRCGVKNCPAAARRLGAIHRHIRATQQLGTPQYAAG